MADRMLAKRDRPEGGGMLEAEAIQPDHIAPVPVSKRIRIEEDSDESVVVHSTTCSIYDGEELQTYGEAPIAEVGGTLFPSSCEATPLAEIEEENADHISLKANQSRTSISLTADSSEGQSLNQSDQSTDDVETFSKGGPSAQFVSRRTETVKDMYVHVSCSPVTITKVHVASSSSCCDVDLCKKLPANQGVGSSELLSGIQEQPQERPKERNKVSGISEIPGVNECVREEVQGGASQRSGEPLRGLREVDVGIVEYISKHKGFHGVIKQRYQDFLVNEVDRTGKVVHLTDMTCPEEKPKNLINIDDVLSDRDQQRLQELTESTDKNSFHCIEVHDFDKDQRKQVHEVIRQDFPALESCTLDGDGKKVIKVNKATRGGRKQRSNWDKNRPNFCRFVIHKENMEVNDALNLISKYSNIKHQSFGFSGTKDKRAITVQEVTVYRVEAERLCRLNSILRGIRLGNFRYVKEQLTLGDHSGNHFVIVLRDVDGTADKIDQALTSVRDVGFINYYGMQRFGNSQVATHLVGRAILHSNWQEAVDLILKPREGNTQDNRWRQLWMDSRDPLAVMDIIPKHKTISIEMQLLKGLKESKNNYLMGLQCIPRNLRLLYIHGYQSYVWNMLVTRRIQKYGTKVILGDLVLSENKPDDDGEHVKPSVVDEAHLDSFSIHDVVMPLPGYAVQYPQNEMGDWYRELLQNDGLDIKNMRHQVKDYSLSGAYRKIVVKPDNVSWSIIPYSDNTVPLVQSDLDKLEGKPLSQIDADGSLRALRLEFTLSSSCYATMAIREILKLDTSASYQAGLNPVQQSSGCTNEVIDITDETV